MIERYCGGKIPPVAFMEWRSMKTFSKTALKELAWQVDEQLPAYNSIGL